MFVFFLAFVSTPVLRYADGNPTTPATLHARLAWLGWISLCVAIVTGTCRLVVQASQRSD
jgi:hypothetical protein